jgi:hypothetical protein
MTAPWRDVTAAVALVAVAEVQVGGRELVSVALAGAYLLVGLASRRPLAVLVSVPVVLVVDALASGVLIEGVAAVLSLAWLGFVAGSRRPPITVALVGGAAAVALATVADQVTSGSFAPANDLLFYAAVVALPGSMGWLVTSRDLQVAQLRARTEQLELHRDVAVRSGRAVEAGSSGPLAWSPDNRMPCRPS